MGIIVILFINNPTRIRYVNVFLLYLCHFIIFSILSKLFISCKSFKKRLHSSKYQLYVPQIQLINIIKKLILFLKKYTVNNPIFYLNYRKYLWAFYYWILIIAGIISGINNMWYSLINSLIQPYLTLEELINTFFTLKLIKFITIATVVTYFLLIINPPEGTIKDIIMQGNYLIIFLKDPKIINFDWVGDRKIRKIIEITNFYMDYLLNFIYYRFGIGFEKYNYGNLMLKVISSKIHSSKNNTITALKEINSSIITKDLSALMKSVDLLLGNLINYISSSSNYVFEIKMANKEPNEFKIIVLKTLVVIGLTFLINFLKHILSLIMIYF